MEGTGFRSMDNLDPCIFISERVVFIVYVDDTFFFGTK